MTDIGMRWLAQKETEKHNRITEEETNRANLANEALKQKSLDETVRHQTQQDKLGWSNLTQNAYQFAVSGLPANQQKAVSQTAMGKDNYTGSLASSSNDGWWRVANIVENAVDSALDMLKLGFKLGG